MRQNIKHALVLATALALPLMAPMLRESHAENSALYATGHIQSYATLVYLNYKDAYDDALKLQKAVEAFLRHPAEGTLRAAKEAWLVSRNSYGQTEAFRFYEGPIDAENGPEGQLNAWPLNEAYIDYVKGNPKAGIINDTSVAITEKTLAEKNQQGDEADVSTGYHAIEFLLWGQDLSLDGPGARPVSDYDPKTTTGKRRAAYLTEVARLLVEDLGSLVKAWEPGKQNYAKSFAAEDEKVALGNILTALATLSGFELASERMATALDSGDQEDEHSCFSDNTHHDLIYNAKGVENVYFGRYGSYQGDGIYDLLKEKDAALAEAIASQIKTTRELIASIPAPIDREVLGAEKGSQGRAVMEKAVASLQKQADLFKQAGNVLGIKVSIAE